MERAKLLTEPAAAALAAWLPLLMWLGGATAYLHLTPPAGWLLPLLAIPYLSYHLLGRLLPPRTRVIARLERGFIHLPPRWFAFPGSRFAISQVEQMRLATHFGVESVYVFFHNGSMQRLSLWGCDRQALLRFLRRAAPEVAFGGEWPTVD